MNDLGTVVLEAPSRIGGEQLRHSSSGNILFIAASMEQP